MSVKFKFIRFQFIVFCFSLFPFTTKAQIEPIQVGTTTRNMLVYAPPLIEKNRPLLLSLHGLNQDINYQRNQTQWETIAQANNFVVVYPAGINNSWDLYGTSDTEFILTIINEMSKRYGIDRKRVYLSGFSMGGMMTYHAANLIADKIAAFAPVSGYLMDGPNTNSSRPIPIIHTHGTSDPVVPYSGVKTCLDAWIARNGCPSTAQVTNPYPVGKTASNGTKYYWGTVKDKVQIVLLSLEGVGHWHSIDPNGVNTSQEIWDFCKNYSLGFGVSEFSSASVIDKNPKQINVSFTTALKKLNSFTGFMVKIDNKTVAINSVELSDSTHVIINLANNIIKENEITLSYNNGNVVSIYEKNLQSLNDTAVVNMLKGASPLMNDVLVNKAGDTLIVKFNMKMQIPSDISTLSLKGDYNGLINIPILQPSFFKNDSTILSFPLNGHVYADYKLLFSYSGNSLVSSDEGLLKPISDYSVTNNSQGLPVHLNSGQIEADGFTVSLAFSKLMKMNESQLSEIILKVNGQVINFKEFSISNKTITLKLTNSVHFGDIVSLSYTAGNITASDNGALESFTDFAITSLVNAPIWQKLPGKIEAESYTFQSGIQTEQTSDSGGGLNVGWIDNGDWMEYAIENSIAKSNYQITSRVASPYGGSVIDYYVDTKSAGSITVPNTGGWQVYQSVSKTISVDAGKHYLKVVATTGGFNINCMEINNIQTGISSLSVGSISIYPNPVSNEMIINTTDFKHNRIEVFNSIGGLIINKKTKGEAIFRFPIHLSNGIYIVKISNEKQSYSTKIVVRNS